MGRKSGRARKRLTLERIERELPALDSYENAQQRLAVVSNWIAAGLLTGTAGHAFVRCHEVWLKAAEAGLSKDLVDGLKQRLDELEVQLKRERNVL